MARPATPAASVDRAVLSMAVVVVPPMFTGTDTVWFCPDHAVPGVPGGGRRPLRIGEHIRPDHELVKAHPTCFAPSPEPVDAWPITVPDRDELKRRQAEQVKLAPALGREVRPKCRRCGAVSAESVDVFDPPGMLDLNSLLAGVVDGEPGAAAERAAIERRIFADARLAQQRQQQLAAAERRWAEEHTACPVGTAPMPEPARPPGPTAVPYRLGYVRSIGG